MEVLTIFIDFQKLFLKLKDWLKDRIHEQIDCQRNAWEERKEWARENRLCERGMFGLIIFAFCWTILYGYVPGWFGQVFTWNTAILEELEDQLWEQYPQCRPKVRGKILRPGYRVDIWIRSSTREYADDVVQGTEDYLTQSDIMQRLGKEYLDRFSIPEYMTLDFLTIYVDVDAGNQRTAEVDISYPEVS